MPCRMASLSPRFCASRSAITDRTRALTLVSVSAAAASSIRRSAKIGMGLDHVDDPQRKQQVRLIRRHADAGEGPPATPAWSSRRTARSAASPRSPRRVPPTVQAARSCLPPLRRPPCTASFCRALARSSSSVKPKWLKSDSSAWYKGCHPDGRTHAARCAHGNRSPPARSRCRRNQPPDSAPASPEAPPPATQESTSSPPSPASRASPINSTVGLISTVSAQFRIASGSSLARALGTPEHEQAQRLEHLRRRQPDARRVLHRVHHVGDQPPDLRRARISHRFTLAQQNGMPHAGDFQKCHLIFLSWPSVSLNPGS